MMTVALPLSAVRMWMELSRRMSCKAESSPLERLGLAGLALRRTSLICSLISSAAVLFSRRRAGSTDWMIYSVGMHLGVRAKFIPSDSYYYYYYFLRKREMSIFYVRMQTNLNAFLVFSRDNVIRFHQLVYNNIS